VSSATPLNLELGVGDSYARYVPLAAWMSPFSGSALPLLSENSTSACAVHTLTGVSFTFSVNMIVNCSMSVVSQRIYDQRLSDSRFLASTSMPLEVSRNSPGDSFTGNRLSAWYGSQS
jgi:hypothetical protein